MADGGEVSGRSDKCQSCSRKGRNNDVVKYCGQCRVSFCSACLEYHDEIFDHLQLHGTDNRGSASSGTVTEESTELCVDHKLPITLYCNVENIFGCVTCMDADHKHCKQVIYLPVSAAALLQDIDITNLNELLAKTIQELETIKLKQELQLTTLIEEKEKCLEKVNDYHTRFLEKFNAIFRSTTDAIDQQFETLRDEKVKHIQHVETSLAAVESSTSRLQQFQDKHVLKFIEARRCQEYIKRAEAASTEAADNLKIEGMDAVIDKRLEDLLTDLKSLATVVRKGPIQVKKKYQVDVSVKGDTKTCHITEACVLPDSSILLVDYTNKKLKRLNGETLTIADIHSLKNNPIGACCIDEEEVAVTTKDRQLIFLDILPKLSRTRTLKFSHHCGYIAHYKDELYITDLGKTLYAYSMQGSLLRTITTDTSGSALFSGAMHVVVNDTGDELFVADWVNGIQFLKRNWTAVNRVENLKSSGTRGVCLDEIGGAFVGDHTAHNVAYINSEGKHANDVLTEADGLLKPLSVCFERTHRRLFVSQEGRNQMMVCEMI